MNLFQKAFTFTFSFKSERRTYTEFGIENVCNAA